MRVSKKSVVAHVAGALAGSLRSNDTTNLDAMGVSANYIAVKSILLAKDFVEEDGINISLTLSKFNTKVGEKAIDKTCIRYTVAPKVE